MIDMNETKLTGNLVADLVTRTVTRTVTGPEGKESTVTRGRIVRTNSHRDRRSGEWIKSELMGFDFELWGKSGENLTAKARKGTAILIEGAWVPNHFEKEDGAKVFGVRLRVNRWQIVAQPGSRTGSAIPGKARSRRKAAAAA